MKRLDFAQQFEKRSDKKEIVFAIALLILFIILVVIIKPDFSCFEIVANQCIG